MKNEFQNSCIFFIASYHVYCRFHNVYRTCSFISFYISPVYYNVGIAVMLKRLLFVLWLKIVIILKQKKFRNLKGTYTYVALCSQCLLYLIQIDRKGLTLVYKKYIFKILGIYFLLGISPLFLLREFVRLYTIVDTETRTLMVNQNKLLCVYMLYS